MSNDPVNPFQAPSVETPYLPRAEDSRLKQPSVSLVFAKWLVICLISAAPSFVMALVLARDSVVDEIVGMFLGIFVFVGLYTFAEMRPQVQALLSDPRKRLTAKIGYGIRIGISILFPVGLYLDIAVGFISVSITTALAGGGSENDVGGFTFHFFTTLVQGTLLNLILLTLMLFIYVLVLAFHRKPDSGDSRVTPIYQTAELADLETSEADAEPEYVTAEEVVAEVVEDAQLDTPKNSDEGR